MVLIWSFRQHERVNSLGPDGPKALAKREGTNVQKLSLSYGHILSGYCKAKGFKTPPFLVVRSRQEKQRLGHVPYWTSGARSVPKKTNVSPLAAQKFPKPGAPLCHAKVPHTQNSVGLVWNGLGYLKTCARSIMFEVVVIGAVLFYKLFQAGGWYSNF